MKRDDFESEFVEGQINNIELRDGSIVFTDYYSIPDNEMSDSEYVSLFYNEKMVALVRRDSIKRCF